MQIQIKLILVSVALFLSGTVNSQTLPGPIVDTAWLAANLDKVQIVDVRSNTKSFTSLPVFETEIKTGKKFLKVGAAHIEGALLIDMNLIRTERTIDGLKLKYMIPEKADFEKIIQAAGINRDKPIVLMSMGSEIGEVNDVLRVYWQFKVYGEDQLAVLDGGMAAWLQESRDFSTDAPAVKAGNWTAVVDRSDQYLAGSFEVASAVENRQTSLIDSRDNKHFYGLVKRDYVTSYGHLAGAKLFPVDLMFKSEGRALKFMSANTYRALFRNQGINTSTPLISYCNSGHLSAGVWFLTSELLGNKSSKLYDGSLHQWTLEGRSLVGAVPLN